MAGLEGRTRPSLTCTPTRSTAQTERLAVWALTRELATTVWTHSMCCHVGSIRWSQERESEPCLQRPTQTSLSSSLSVPISKVHGQPLTCSLSLAHPKHCHRLVVPFAPYLLQDKPSATSTHPSHLTHPTLVTPDKDLTLADWVAFLRPRYHRSFLIFRLSFFLKLSCPSC